MCKSDHDEQTPYFCWMCPGPVTDRSHVVNYSDKTRVALSYGGILVSQINLLIAPRRLNYISTCDASEEDDDCQLTRTQLRAKTAVGSRQS